MAIDRTARPAIDRTVTRTGAHHAITSHHAADAAAYRSGSLRREMYDLFKSAGARGATDDEMEKHFQKPHQTISSARNTLSMDGWIADGGQRRPTRTGSDAIVWVALAAGSAPVLPSIQEESDEARQAALFGDQPEEPVTSATVPLPERRVATALAKSYGGVWSAHLDQAAAVVQCLRGLELD